MTTPADYDFELPPEQIAQQPAPERRGARLLLLGHGDRLEHRSVAELPDLLAQLEPAPLLVVNQ